MKRGRPPKPDKLTNSEKAKKYRERKKQESEKISSELAALKAEICNLKTELASYRMRYEACHDELMATRRVLEILRKNNATKKVAIPENNSSTSPKNSTK